MTPEQVELVNDLFDEDFLESGDSADDLDCMFFIGPQTRQALLSMRAAWTSAATKNADLLEACRALLLCAERGITPRDVARQARKAIADAR